MSGTGEHHEGDDALRKKSEQAISFLSSHGVVFDKGLSDSEVVTVQQRFDFQFPHDLRVLLQMAMPIAIKDNNNNPFPNWRSSDLQHLHDRLAWPFNGIAFDIEHNAFWLDNWGPRPEQLANALAIARRHVDAAPRMIPIYSHRYIPSEPVLAGNPIFSMHQTDIIFYGTDLWDYFGNEFSPQDGRWQRCRGMSAKEYQSAHRQIRFWTDFVS